MTETSDTKLRHINNLHSGDESLSAVQCSKWMLIMLTVLEHPSISNVDLNKDFSSLMRKMPH